MCKQNCTAKGPTEKSCTRVVTRTEYVPNEDGKTGTLVVIEEEEELECEEGCNYYVTNATTGECECVSNCTFVTDMTKEIKAPCFIDDCDEAS